MRVKPVYSLSITTPRIQERRNEWKRLGHFYNETVSMVFWQWHGHLEIYPSKIFVRICLNYHFHHHHQWYHWQRNVLNVTYGKVINPSLQNQTSVSTLSTNHVSFPSSPFISPSSCFLPFLLIVTLPIEPFHEFALIASDGLWEVFTAQEAVNFLRGWLLSSDPKNPGVKSRTMTNGIVNDACEQLVNAALARGSTDNISAVMIMLH